VLPAPTTIASWLTQTTLDRTDAEALLCHVLAAQRSYLYSHNDERLVDAVLQQLNALADRRAGGEPLAYIVGYTEFWSMHFTVTDAVLIPRDDTGCLVQRALQSWHALPDEGSVVDAGTGSGAVAIAVAVETNSHVIATDVSTAALAVAADNAQRLAPGLIECRHMHWLQGLAQSCVKLLLSNPPYIAANDPHLLARELQCEPHSALVSGRDGLDAIRELIDSARRVLVPNGMIALEHGHDQGAAVRNLLHDAGYKEVTTDKDLSGHDRVSHARYH